MRWIGPIVAVCLLVAGAAPNRADRERARPHDEIAAVKALAKVVGRRSDGARPIGTVGLDVFALVSADAAPPPPSADIEIVHSSPLVRRIVVESPFDARGPPVG